MEVFKIIDCFSQIVSLGLQLIEVLAEGMAG